MEEAGRVAEGEVFESQGFDAGGERGWDVEWFGEDGWVVGDGDVGG